MLAGGGVKKWGGLVDGSGRQSRELERGRFDAGLSADAQTFGT